MSLRLAPGPVLVLALLLTGTLAMGQGGLPSPQDDHVNDFAGVLAPGDAEAIQELFRKLEHQTGIEAVVVTVGSIRQWGAAEESIESLATRLFNAWGVGHAEDNDGILILVAVHDRECRIELGGAYGRRYDAVMKRVIDEKMIPHFKRGEYSRGLYEGSRAAVERVTREVSWLSFYKYHLLVAVLIVACIAAGVSCMRKGKTGWGWAFFAAAGILLLFLLKMVIRGKSSSGFGGGSSFGGGASGSW